MASHINHWHWRSRYLRRCTWSGMTLLAPRSIAATAVRVQRTRSSAFRKNERTPRDLDCSRPTAGGHCRCCCAKRSDTSSQLYPRGREWFSVAPPGTRRGINLRSTKFESRAIRCEMACKIQIAGQTNLKVFYAGVLSITLLSGRRVQRNGRTPESKPICSLSILPVGPCFVPHNSAERARRHALDCCR
jgi:hypothetical protein